jgi:mRNA-degrading endonuclease RelE of RelBE toxin-antitoxin system
VIKPEFAPYELIYELGTVHDVRDLTTEQAEQLIRAVERFAETGVGSIDWMQGYYLMRLKTPPFRVIFAVERRTIRVVLIDARDQVYSKRNLNRLKPYRK